MIHHHTFDPLVGFSKDDCPLPGIQVWPGKRLWRKAHPRILCLGGSTTMWPNGQSLECDHLLGKWGMFLGELLSSDGYRPLIFNAAACGYCTDQELLRLLRDAPGLHPQLVISLSGVNDMGYFHSSEPYPMTHLFQANLARKIARPTADFHSYILGVPWKVEPHVRWLRNVRLCRCIAADLGAEYLSCLQPHLGIGKSPPTSPAESDMLSHCFSRPCRGETYIEQARTFYSEIRRSLDRDPGAYKHVVDLVDVFEGKTGMWADHRHPNDEGNRVLAQRIYKTIQDRKLLSLNQ